MYKGNYIDIDALKRKKNRKIKSTFRLLVYLITIILIIFSSRLWQENKELKHQVKDLTVMATAERVELPTPARGNVNRVKSLGTFQIYHYCPCAKCCGKTDGITASGTRAREGETIAVDPSVIPLGTTVIIDGHEYTAEDSGAGITGKKIDIFIGSHEEALRLGVKEAEVYIEGGLFDVSKDLP